MRHEKTNRLRLLITILGLGVLPAFTLLDNTELDLNSTSLQIEGHDIQLAALEILNTKCNTCHLTQNPRKVFKLENMKKLAQKIHKRVFIKKRIMVRNSNLHNRTIAHLKNASHTI